MFCPILGFVRIALLVAGAILILLAFGLAFTIYGIVSLILGIVAIAFGAVRKNP
jgi:hypothetical protein